MGNRYLVHKINPHLQGYDQLKYDKPYLVICSSLKDAMCLASIGYNIEVIAPDSENTMIKPHVIEYLKKKYKKVITLFDNDDAGRKTTQKLKLKIKNVIDCSSAYKKHNDLNEYLISKKGRSKGLLI